MTTVTLISPSDSNPSNNPNHPLIRCVDGTGPYGEWTSADDTMQPVVGPYRVFDVLNQRHVGPKFPFRYLADMYLRILGGARAPTKS